MSTCWRCEKVLPDGQVECDPPCDQLPLDGTCDEAGGKRVPEFIQVQVNLNVPAVAADREKFDKAMRMFMAMMNDITEMSGLSEFCKRKPTGGSCD